jgi:hypothetical protein
MASISPPRLITGVVPTSRDHHGAGCRAADPFYEQGRRTRCPPDRRARPRAAPPDRRPPCGHPTPAAAPPRRLLTRTGTSRSPELSRVRSSTRSQDSGGSLTGRPNFSEPVGVPFPHARRFLRHQVHTGVRPSLPVARAGARTVGCLGGSRLDTGHDGVGLPRQFRLPFGARDRPRQGSRPWLGCARLAWAVARERLLLRTGAPGDRARSTSLGHGHTSAASNAADKPGYP